MKRPWHVWTAFLLCLVVVVVGLGWISWTALALDRSEAEARREAALEENVRLALWRMDSALASVLAEENSRPYFVYSAYYSSELAQGREWNNDLSTIVPSPLLGMQSSKVALYFQFEPGGRLTSPQIPTSGKTAAPVAPADAALVAAAGERLAALRRLVDREKLIGLLPAPPEASIAAGAPAVASTVTPNAGARSVGEQQLRQLEPPQQSRDANQGGEFAQQAAIPQQAANSALQNGVYDEQQQRKRGAAEFYNRTQLLRDNARLAPGNNYNPNWSFPAAIEAVSGGPMTPLWVGGEILLARRVAIRGQLFVQGCWLDWPAVERWLTASVADLLPAASLLPADAMADDEGQRLLAALPVRLEPGAIPWEDAAGLTPVQYALVVGWACAVLAAAAVAVLLFGVLSLSERRAAFVSAVTHELRTPLTTFRMYAEMLAEGMVPEGEKRAKYLHTLRVEADRLMHLVENVLSYARLERGRARGRVETAPLAELVERVQLRLAERAAQADMRLESPVEIPPLTIKADFSAVEQILFNLVDNACKYGVGGDERTIHLEAGSENGAAIVRIRDHGPGIAPAESKRLFQPFVKSARDAANTAPGIGLGLALSRRLARTMGGDLRVDAARSDGACFVLSLPAA